jgi:hypothetical protein
LGVYLILSNWSDYRDTLMPSFGRSRLDRRRTSVKRVQSGVINLRSRDGG